MQGHPSRLGLVVVLDGADGCNVVDWGSTNINRAVYLKYVVQRWWCVWPKYCTTLKGEEIAEDSIDATHPCGSNAGKCILLYPLYNHNYLITKNKI
jgi:hypothetical protein